MDNFRYVNAGDSTLSAGIVAGDTQISVANPGRFPAALEVGEKLVLTLHPSGLPSTQEIVICTAISGGVMTVTRGAQGTTAQEWPAGTVVGAYLTSEMLGQIRDKLMPISGTNTGDETAARIGTLTAGAAAKTTPVDADLIGLADSAASNTLKKLTWSALKAALKTYFDKLYNKYVHPNHSGDVTSVADGAQTIAANAVTNMKLADMANATIKGRVTAGAGDPEDLTAAQARSILNVADGAQKNSDITKAEIEAKLTGIISTHSHAAGNADTVDGYHAQKTAAADKIPVSGSDGVLADGWLPTRLGTVCKTITDWNAATETGWYMGSYTTANAPGADWMMGEVIKHNDGWICQRVCRFAIDGVWFVRYLKGGVWSAWVHLVTEPSHIHWYAVPKDAGFNGVGSFCWGRNNSSSNIAAGGTLAGSSISAMGLLPNVNTNGWSLNMGSGGTLAGTWRCLGLGYKNYTTLWQRIA